MTERWRKQIILFLVSQSITLFGSQIVQMAIVWYVTLQTGSGAWVAAFSLGSYLPQFFISFLGGVWADRYSRKQLIIWADTLIAAVTLVMLLMMPRITESVMMLTALLLMSFIRSAGAGIQNPAVNAAIAQLVPEEHLMHYNGVNATMQSVAQFAAPAVAAVILTAGSLRATLAIDLVTAAMGIGLLGCVWFPGRENTQEAPSAPAQIGAGLRFVFSCGVVRKVLIVYALFIFFTVPAGYLAGLFVSRVYGDTYWYLTAVELVGFGGMLAGGLLMSAWGGFRNRNLTLAAGLLVFGLMAIGMGVIRQFGVYLVLMGLYGVALTAVQTTITTMLQENTESSMQGRVFGLMSSLYSSCYPLGMVLFGPMADRIPLQWIMAFSGIALILVAGFAWKDRKNPHR